MAASWERRLGRIYETAEVKGHTSKYGRSVQIQWHKIKARENVHIA
jgi:hypothetical protein